jgi:hypothetical protein
MLNTLLPEADPATTAANPRAAAPSDLVAREGRPVAEAAWPGPLALARKSAGPEDAIVVTDPSTWPAGAGTAADP